jgi:hypothetical protein
MRVLLKLLAILVLALFMASLVCSGGEFDPLGMNDHVQGAVFEDPADGTLIERHPARSPVWQKVASGRAMTWADAVEYCGRLPVAGRTWRLPERAELETLVTGMGGGECKMALPLQGPCGFYWASDAGAREGGDATNRGFTDMRFGGSGYEDAGRSLFVRCIAK